MEHAQHGTLRSYIRTRRLSPANHQQIRYLEILLGDVASGLAALHDCGIVHGDVKLDNVLVFPSRENPAQATAKVSDFGHVVVLNRKNGAKDEGGWYVGTAIYNAPEVLKQTTHPLSSSELIKCDIWAFGLLVWEACINGDEFWTRIPKKTTPPPSTSSSSPLLSSQTTESVASASTYSLVASTSNNKNRSSSCHQSNSKQPLNLPPDSTIQSSQDSSELRDLAKQALPGSKSALGIAMFLRVTLHMTLQEDPAKRVASARVLPLFTQWNAGGLVGVAADIALHLATPVPTYEMFRLDNGRDISWPHQQQIFQGLLQAFQVTNSNSNLAKNCQSAALAWQIALCHYHGFGIEQSTPEAHRYARQAQMEENNSDVDPPTPFTPSSSSSPPSYDQQQHPLAAGFAELFAPIPLLKATYTQQIVDLLRCSSNQNADRDNATALPLLTRACFDGDVSVVLDLLERGSSPNTSTIDGSGLLHWLFMLPETGDQLQRLVSILRKYDLACLNPQDDDKEENEKAQLHQQLLIDAPCTLSREIHAQWPLRLLGSPLAIAISVNSAASVRALLDLGADLLAPAYFGGTTSHIDTEEYDLAGDDERNLPDHHSRPATSAHWTPLHIAAKYHNSELLKLLIDQVMAQDNEYKLPQLSPSLASTLSFSTGLERTAMHGSAARDRLHETLGLIQEWQGLDTVESNGMTPLMRAIDFQDRDVVAALLAAESDLATMPMRAPDRESELYNYPIHFAVQIAARWDADDTLAIPRIIAKAANQPDSMEMLTPPLLRDHLGRTPLHMAVTGASNRVARWILDEGAVDSDMLDEQGLQDVQDYQGQTALFYCRSAPNAHLLLEKGANIRHTSKNGMTALHQACLVGDVDVVRTLIGVDKSLLDPENQYCYNNPYGTPLHCAVFSGSMELVMLLADAGAPLEATDRKGNTALHVAVRLNRPSMLRFLVSRAETAPRDRKEAAVGGPPAYHGQGDGAAQQDWQDSDFSNFEWDMDSTLASIGQANVLFGAADLTGHDVAADGVHHMPASSHETFDDRQHRMQLMDSLCKRLGAGLAEHDRLVDRESVDEELVDDESLEGASVNKPAVDETFVDESSVGNIFVNATAVDEKDNSKIHVDKAASIVALLMTDAMWQSPRVDDLYAMLRHIGALLTAHLEGRVGKEGDKDEEIHKSTEEGDDMLNDFIARWIAHILAQTKPAGAFPGRSEEHIKDIVQGELKLAKEYPDSDTIADLVTSCSAQAARLAGEWQAWRKVQAAAATTTAAAAAAAAQFAKEENENGGHAGRWDAFSFMRNGEQVKQVASMEDAWKTPPPSLSVVEPNRRAVVGTPLEAQRWSR